jgi:hypothetical protein
LEGSLKIGRKKMSGAILSTKAIAVIFVAIIMVLVSNAYAQDATNLAGTWSVVSVVAEQDGNKVQPYGPNPKGILMFDQGGRYSLLLLRPDLPKFASNNRARGTAEENKAVIEGSNAHFGTYAVESGKNLVFRIGPATFPNWNGVEQRRPFTLQGDELRYVVPAASGGGTSELVWKRVK